LIQIEVLLQSTAVALLKPTTESKPLSSQTLFDLTAVDFISNTNLQLINQQEAFGVLN
jgi:hypothetical protein